MLHPPQTERVSVTIAILHITPEAGRYLISRRLRHAAKAFFVLCHFSPHSFVRKKCAFFLSSAARSDLDLAPPGPKAENGTATTGRRVCCRPWVCSLNFSTCRTILLRCVPSVPPGGLFVASQQHPATVSFAWRVLFNAGVYGPFDERSGCRC